MILKIILIGIIIYLLYRAFGGKIELPKAKKKQKVQEKKQNLQELEANTLVECSKCGVFLAYKEAIVKKGKIYCEDCFKEVN
jgi:formylmethanofuran dehydrogenase subunit E